MTLEAGLSPAAKGLGVPRKTLSRGYIDGDGLPQRGVRRPRALGAPKVYPEGGKLINEFEAGLSRPEPALADRKILIQRVYRRACARMDEAYAARAPLAPLKFIQRGES